MGSIINKISEKCSELSKCIKNKNELSSSLLNNNIKNNFIEKNNDSHNYKNENKNKCYELDLIYMDNYTTLSSYKKINNNNYFISLKNFEILKLIGAGSYGKVFLVKIKNSKNSNLYAMKILEKEKIKKLKQSDRILTEREILEKIDHPFISKLVYAFQDNDNLYIVTDFMSGGDLMHKLISYGRISENLVKVYAAELFLAIQYLHENDIIFRDLKPENILLDIDGHLKLTDFGLSKKFENKNSFQNINDSPSSNKSLHKKTFSICGTYQYIAPEVYNGIGYGDEIDWWSYGIVLYEMLTGKFPFIINKNRKIISTNINWREKYDNYMSPEAKDILFKLLDININNRLIDEKEIKKHKFFNDINWDLIYKKEVVIENLTNNIIENNFDKKYIENEEEVKKVINKKDEEYINYDDNFFDNFSYQKEQILT